MDRSRALAQIPLMKPTRAGQLPTLALTLGPMPFSRSTRWMNSVGANIGANVWSRRKRVYVNEHLTRSNARLFHLAREAGQRSRYKYVWTREGRIYARKEDGVSAVRIRSDADIKEIFGDGKV